MKIKITYLDQQDQEQVVIAEVDSMDPMTLITWYDANLGFIPQSVVGEIIE
jgi:hypothetical protein